MRSIFNTAAAVTCLLLVACSTITPSPVFHNVLRKQTIARLDVDAIRQLADRREPFRLRLGGNDVAVRVKPNRVWTDACTQVIADATPSHKGS